MNKSDTITALSKALAKAQGEIENASKNAANPHFRSRYADLAEVLNTVRPVFSKHGLAVTQFPSFADGVASVETILTHESGEWMSGIASAPVSKPDAQGVGSAITYLRRYSLAAVAGIAQEDDDANASVGRPQGGSQSKAVATADTFMPSSATPPKPTDAEYKELVKQYADTINTIRYGIDDYDSSDADDKADLLAGAYSAWAALDEKTKHLLWRAPSDGGCFTTRQREVMLKSADWAANRPEGDK